MTYILKGILAIMLLSSFQMVAQNGTTNLTLTSDMVKVNGYNTPISSTLTKVDNSLTWTQHTDTQDVHVVFTINNVTGNWNQNMSTGSINHTMTVDDVSGVFSMTGNANQITATLVTDYNSKITEYVFNISTITYPQN